MVEHQVGGGTGAFAHWLQELTGLLDPGGGWYAVFLRRDPEGIRACAGGAELPPWDVVESLLQDFAALRGAEPARAQTVRARQLHRAAAADRDQRPGGRTALHTRLDLMLREQTRAADRARDLTALLATAPEGSAEAGRLAVDLAWLQDDHTRATARVAELRTRLASLDGGSRERGGGEPPQDGGAARQPSFHRGGQHAGEARQHPVAQGNKEVLGRRPDAAPLGGGRTSDAPGKRSRTRGAAQSRRPRGARYAWLEDADQDDGPMAAPPEVVPQAGAPTGARFGGGAEEHGPHPAPAAAPAPVPGPDDRRAVAHAVSALPALRAQGRGGEAHALLCEAARWPAARLPLLAAALHRAGLAADWATLLWEAAALPTERLAELAGALAGAGHEGDARQLLRQGAAREPEDLAAAVTGPGATGAVRALVEAFVDVRSPEDTARFAACAPHRLVPQVLEAVREVAPAREAALVHALRVARLIAT